MGLRRLQAGDPLLGLYLDEVLAGADSDGRQRPRRADDAARCVGNGGRCGQKLATLWHCPSGSIVVVRSPLVERTPAERKAVQSKSGRLKAPDGIDLLAADPATLEAGEAARAWCTKHGHRTVDLTTMADVT